MAAVLRLLLHHGIKPPVQKEHVVRLVHVQPHAPRLRRREQHVPEPLVVVVVVVVGKLDLLLFLLVLPTTTTTTTTTTTRVPIVVAMFYHGGARSLELSEHNFATVPVVAGIEVGRDARPLALSRLSMRKSAPR